MAAYNFGMLFTSIVLAFATICLVVVTIYYAWQTRRMVLEMQKQGKNSALPFIAFKHSAHGDNGDPNKSARHKVINTGPGTALQIRAEITVIERREERPESVRRYDLPALGSGSEHEVFIVLSNHQIKRFKATYRDVYENEFRVDQEVVDDTSGNARYWINDKPMY